MSMAITAMAPWGLIMPSSTLMYTHLYAHAALQQTLASSPQLPAANQGGICAIII